MHVLDCERQGTPRRWVWAILVIIIMRTSVAVWEHMVDFVGVWVRSLAALHMLWDALDIGTLMLSVKGALSDMPNSQG